MLRERNLMRTLALAATLLILPAAAAHAEIADDARSATAACLSAVIDGAPVGDVTEGPISIRRGKDPVSCTVSISDGAPVQVYEGVVTAIRKRPELFTPMKTRWNPEAFAMREAYCNLSLRRHLNVVVSTGKPGLRPVVVATVFESRERDGRCDRDLGLQTVAAADNPAASAVSAPPPPTELTPPPPKEKKKGWMPRIPGLSKKD